MNLVFACGLGELAVSFDHLANACRADRMAITDEAAAWVDRQAERRWLGSDLGAHSGQRRRPGLQQSGASAARNETEDFISDDLGYRKTVVNFRRLKVAWVDTRHNVGPLGRSARDGEIGHVLLFKRQAVRSVTIAEQADCGAPRQRLEEACGT